MWWPIKDALLSNWDEAEIGQPATTEVKDGGQ